MKRQTETEHSRIKKQVTIRKGMKQRVKTGVKRTQAGSARSFKYVRAYTRAVADYRSKNNKRAVDELDANVNAAKQTAKLYIQNKVIKGGTKAALYPIRRVKRTELMRKMRDYIYANGTLERSGLEDKLPILSKRERTELDNLIKDVKAKKLLKHEEQQKQVFENAKKHIEENGVIQDVKIKEQILTLPKEKQQELHKLESKYRRNDLKNKLMEKMSKNKSFRNTGKSAMDKYKKEQGIRQVLEKGKKGVTSVMQKLAISFKAAITSTTGIFVVAAILIIAFVGLVIPSAVTSSSRMDTRQRIIEVAQGEIGTVGGDKYRKWYTGSADGQPWCATFVSWCAEQCGLIEQGVFPKFQGCNPGVEWFKQQGIFDYTPQYGGTEYTPQMGDVIFFTGSYSKYDSTHVGLVQGVENGQVLTIEGNTSNAVLPRRYSLDNPRILGYARPVYPISSYGAADFSGDDAAEIVRNFLKSMGCSDAAIAGVLGNMYGESGVNPAAIEKSNGEGHGLCQWSFGRKTRLFQRAAAAGKPWQDIEVQLTLMWDELNGLDAATKNILDANYGGIEGFKRMTSVELATEAFCLAFERPDNAGAMVRKRIPYARRYYQLYAGKL